MFEWWATLDIVTQIFYCIAIPATLVIVLQTILIMLGMGHGDAGVDISDTSGIGYIGDISDIGDIGGDVADIGDISDVAGAHSGAGAHDVSSLHTADMHDGGNPADYTALQIFTLQGIMIFLCIFGWSGIIFMGLGLHIAVTLAISAVLGAGAMVGAAKLIQLSKRLAHNGNINIKNLLGAKGNVYLPIPAKGKGTGKVTVAAGEIYAEYGAVTDDDESIPTGTPIRVIDIRGDLLAVERDK